MKNTSNTKKIADLKVTCELYKEGNKKADLKAVFNDRWEFKSLEINGVKYDQKEVNSNIYKLIRFINNHNIKITKLNDKEIANSFIDCNNLNFSSLAEIKNEYLREFIELFNVDTKEEINKLIKYFYIKNVKDMPVWLFDTCYFDHLIKDYDSTYYFYDFISIKWMDLILDKKRDQRIKNYKKEAFKMFK